MSHDQLILLHVRRRRRWHLSRRRPCCCSAERVSRRYARRIAGLRQGADGIARPQSVAVCWPILLWLVHRIGLVMRDRMLSAQGCRSPGEDLGRSWARTVEGDADLHRREDRMSVQRTGLVYLGDRPAALPDRQAGALTVLFAGCSP